MYLGIVGAGGIVSTALPVLRALPIERLAICGRPQSREKLRRVAAGAGIADIYTDYAALLASGVDAVYIALPNDLHVPYARQALLSGADVIVEKPIAETSAGLEELLRLAEQKGRVLLEAMNLHALPAFRELRRDIGEVGQPRLALLNYSQYSSRYDAFRQGTLAPVFDRQRSGGALMDLNVYNLHAALDLFGPPLRVTYRASLQRGIDTSGTLVLQYGGFQAVCVGAKDCRSPSPSFIQGEDGCVTLPEPVNQLQEYEIITPQGRRRVRRPYGENRLFPEFQAMLRVIQERDLGEMRRLWSYSRDAVRVMEEARRQAGIVFPCDTETDKDDRRTT